MKTIVSILAALLLAAPAWAVVDITCEKTDEDAGAGTVEVTVSYDASVGEPNLVRAFGLDISIDCGTITDVYDVNPNYRIYPGQIVIENGAVTDYNTPYAPGDLGDTSVIVEAGSLYTTDPAYSGDPDAGYNMIPGPSGVLLKFEITCDTCETVVVSISENAARGGVVMEDASNPTVNSPGCEVECPAGGCATCLGDLDGNNFIMVSDMFDLIGRLGRAGSPYIIPPGHAEWNDCADMDANGFMMVSDLFNLIAMLGQAGAPYIIPCP
jgi:hypothetical protein